MLIGDGQIRQSIAIEVAYRSGDGPTSRREADRGLEASVPVS